MTASGTTGDHPSTDSLQSDGTGFRDTGITEAMSSSTPEDTGSDSRATSGSDMELPSQSSQRSQEVKRSADLSLCSRSLDSQAPSVKRLFQDAKSELVKLPSGTCGKTEATADSSVVN